jgi:hypothetical protein
VAIGQRLLMSASRFGWKGDIRLKRGYPCISERLTRLKII